METNILIVDDEAAIADLVEVYLKNEGYTVHKFGRAGTPWPVWPPRRLTWPSWM